MGKDLIVMTPEAQTKIVSIRDQLTDLAGFSKNLALP